LPTKPKTIKEIFKAVADLKKTRPDIKDPVAYVQTVEKIIEKRREDKYKKK
jgi:hypothetical protein